LKQQTIGAGRLLVLIDHERTNETHAVVAKTPLSVVAICGASEGHSAQHQKIASAAQEVFDCGPSLFRKSGAVGKNQKASGRCGQKIGDLIRVREPSSG